MDFARAPNFGCNVYAAGLPPDMNDQQLHDLFAPYGLITSARIMRAKATRASKGYGFVLFEDIKSASQAVTALNGLIIGGHRIQARLAHPDASSALRKFTKRTGGLPSPADHSTTISPIFQGLSAPLPLPSAPQPTMLPASYPFATAVSTSTTHNSNDSKNSLSNILATQQLFTAAALPGFPNGAAVAAASAPPSAIGLCAPGLNGGVPAVAALGTQPLILPQQPIYILMLSQDGQPTINYPA